MTLRTNTDQNPNSVAVPCPFAICDTRTCTIAGRTWLAHWRDESTLMLTPDYAPVSLWPSRIYGRSDNASDGGFQFFSLTPDDALIREALKHLDQAYDVLIDFYVRDYVAPGLDRQVTDAGSAILKARQILDAALASAP
jgi:hypothetical protein